MSINRSILVVLIMSFVTIVLRILPFIFFSSKKETPKLIVHLGKVLPSAVMAMLVVYCLKDTSFTNVSGFVPQFVASLVVIVSYLWKRSSLLSIILGTITFMILV